MQHEISHHTSTRSTAWIDRSARLIQDEDHIDHRPRRSFAFGYLDYVLEVLGRSETTEDDFVDANSITEEAEVVTAADADTAAPPAKIDRNLVIACDLPICGEDGDTLHIIRPLACRRQRPRAPPRAIGRINLPPLYFPHACAAAIASSGLFLIRCTVWRDSPRPFAMSATEAPSPAILITSATCSAL